MRESLRYTTSPRASRWQILTGHGGWVLTLDWSDTGEYLLVRVSRAPLAAASNNGTSSASVTNTDGLQLPRLQGESLAQSRLELASPHILTATSRLWTAKVATKGSYKE